MSARDNSSLEFDSLTPVESLAGKVVGCFVHGGVQQRGGFVLWAAVCLSFEALCRWVGGLFASQ